MSADSPQLRPHPRAAPGCEPRCEPVRSSQFAPSRASGSALPKSGLALAVGTPLRAIRCAAAGCDLRCCELRRGHAPHPVAPSAPAPAVRSLRCALSPYRASPPGEVVLRGFCVAWGCGQRAALRGCTSPLRELWKRTPSLRSSGWAFLVLVGALSRHLGASLLRRGERTRGSRKPVNPRCGTGGCERLPSPRDGVAVVRGAVA